MWQVVFDPFVWVWPECKLTLAPWCKLLQARLQLLNTLHFWWSEGCLELRHCLMGFWHWMIGRSVLLLCFLLWACWGSLRCYVLLIPNCLLNMLGLPLLVRQGSQEVVLFWPWCLLLVWLAVKRWHWELLGQCCLLPSIENELFAYLLYEFLVYFTNWLSVNRCLCILYFGSVFYWGVWVRQILLFCWIRVIELL